MKFLDTYNLLFETKEDDLKEYANDIFLSVERSCSDLSSDLLKGIRDGTLKNQTLEQKIERARSQGETNIEEWLKSEIYDNENYMTTLIVTELDKIDVDYTDKNLILSSLYNMSPYEGFKSACIMLKNKH